MRYYDNKRKNMRLSLVYIFVVALYLSSTGQGCSDAGLCTVAGLDSGSGSEESSITARISTIFGLGEQNVFHLSSEFDMVIPTFNNQLVQIKIPYNFTFGNLGNTSGLGDLSITLNQAIISGKSTSFILIGGVKVPSSDANKSMNGFPLPMAYQSSLGTYDIIVGISSVHKNWHFGLGYQHSFSHNLNEFEHRPDNPAYFNNYNESYQLKRADDLMARVEYRFKLKKTKLMVGALPIYHLGEDEIKGGQKVSNSSGLTLNIVAKLQKQLKNNWNMEFVLAAPAIDKEVRPDGLTRSFVGVVSFKKTIMK